MSKRPKLTEEEKARRRHKRRANKMNKSEQEQMPLFAELLPVHTEESMYWQWRKNKARAAEHGEQLRGGQLLDLLQVFAAIRPFVRSLVGYGAFEKLDSYCRDTLPQDHWYGFWCDVVAGRRVVFEYVWIEENDKRRITASDYYERQHMTKEEFYTLFPFKDHKPLMGGFEVQGEAVLERASS